MLLGNVKFLLVSSVYSSSDLDYSYSRRLTNDVGQYDKKICPTFPFKIVFQNHSCSPLGSMVLPVYHKQKSVSDSREDVIM